MCVSMCVCERERERMMMMMKHLGDAGVAAGTLLSVALLSVLLLHELLRRRRSRTRRSFPGGPPAWPIVGHIPLLLKGRAHQVLAELSMKAEGPMMGLRLGCHRAVVVSSAALAQELLLSHDRAFANRVRFLFTDALLYGYESGVIFSSYSPRWVWLRKLYTLQLLSAKRIHQLRHIRYAEVCRVLEKLHDASTGGTHGVDIGSFIADMSANTISRMVQSKTLKEVDAELPKLIRAAEELILPTIGDFFPFLKFMDTLPMKKMKSLHNRIDKVFDSIIKERNQLLTKCPPDELPNDFLQVLISMRTEELLSTHELKAIMLDTFGAGITTSAATLEWAIAELLQNPQCLHKLKNEIDTMTKDRQDIVSDDDVQKMPYLDIVVREVLRLHPIVPLLIPRVSSVECQVSNYTLPKGTQAFINVWAIARDPSIWEKPLEFYPERFHEKELDVYGKHYELLPFGAGRRMCPGMHLGLNVVQVTLANLVKFFDWELPHGQNPTSIDMRERASLTNTKALPMLAIPKIRQCIPVVS